MASRTLIFALGVRTPCHARYSVTRQIYRSPIHTRAARPFPSTIRTYASEASKKEPGERTTNESPEGKKVAAAKESATDAATKRSSSSDEPYTQKPDASSSASSSSSESGSLNFDWEENPDFEVQKFNDLPYTNFGVNQHIIIDKEFKEVLRRLLWQFRAPIRYAFAYGSGVFPQSKGGTASEADIRAVHPKAPLAVQRAQDGSPKMIDYIFGVKFTQHWHSLNLNQHRNHYSALGSLGSGAVSYVQDNLGAGVYFNPYVNADGILIKYGVVNIDTLRRDLSEWDTLYLAGRLHKPVKILRDDPQVRLANQINLLSAIRTALLLLPPTFTERDLYSTIAGISYLGDPRMAFPTENPRKVANIVNNNMLNFRRLYAPLVEALPNVEFDDPRTKSADWISTTEGILNLRQDMDPVKRSNMVRRLPKAFRSKLYFKYQEKFQIPRGEFEKMMEESKNEDANGFRRQQGGGFERRIAQDDPQELRKHVRDVIKKTINWPSTTQSLKGVLTSGFSRSLRYLGEKWNKNKQGKRDEKDDKKKDDEKKSEDKKSS